MVTCDAWWPGGDNAGFDVGIAVSFIVFIQMTLRRYPPVAG